VPQIAINWLLRRPTVSSVIVGARNEEQLRQNLGAVGWSLTPEQVARLDAASAVTPAYPHYPYWREGGFREGGFKHGQSAAGRATPAWPRRDRGT
jgi:diketogulonate reductase-like aldo/keto reductase